VTEFANVLASRYASSAMRAIWSPEHKVVAERRLWLAVLRTHGRYAISGAIGGPLVELDLRTLYLKDLTLFGCTSQDDEVFPNLIGYLERGELVPLVAATYPLSAIAEAQRDFEAKRHVGKLVLMVPPAG